MFKAGLNFFVGKIGQQRNGNSAHCNNCKIGNAPMRNAVAIDCDLITGVDAEPVQTLLKLFYLLIGFIVRYRLSRHK